jgi:hypothetical protein
MATEVIKYRTRHVAAKKRRHSRGGFTLPLAVVAGFAPAAMDAWNVGKIRKDQPGGRVGGMLHMVALDFAAYNTDTNSMDTNHLGTGWGAVVLGIAAHKFLGGTLGVNRMLARAKIPVIRI